MRGACAATTVANAAAIVSEPAISEKRLDMAGAPT
jgi:hypothetical protein